MQDSPARFRAVVGAGWTLLAIAAAVYARMKGIPAAAALPIAAAFLIEFPFYLWPAFASPRQWLASQSKIRAATLLAAGALLPWLVLSVPTGEFRAANLLLLLIVSGAVSFWYVLLPARPFSDALLLFLVAGVQIAKLFNTIYLSPVPKVPVSILGHAMLIHTAALAFLVIRGGVNADFRLLPDRREWLYGLGYFAIMLPVTGTVYWALGLVKLRPHPLNVFLVLATFFGVLWFVALSEEFFLRGLLQQWLERWTGSPHIALILATLVSGAAHLGFRGPFPNWRMAIVAAIFHLFCGLAWQRTRTIQAGMVAHALTVTLWLAFFV